MSKEKIVLPLAEVHQPFVDSLREYMHQASMLVVTLESLLSIDKSIPEKSAEIIRERIEAFNKARFK